MNRYLKSLMLSGLMATLVIATGCQNKKPQLADEEATEQEATTGSSDDKTPSTDRDGSDSSDCSSDDNN